VLQLQAIMDAAEEALLREARGVFGDRVYPDRTTPFDVGVGKRILPAVCLYTPQIEYSTEGRALTRGRFMFSSEILTLEVWARVDAGSYKSTDLHDKAQAKALRLAVQTAVDALFRSNTLMALFSQIPKMLIRLGADVVSQARADAAVISLTGANQGNFAACTTFDAVPLKSIFLGYDLVVDPNDANAVDARYTDLDKE